MELEAAGFCNTHVANIACGSDIASLIVAEVDAATSENGGLANGTAVANRRSITIFDQKGARETELAAALMRNLLTGGHHASRLDDDAVDGNSDIVVHFPTLTENPLGSMELLSARCLDIKACAERFGKKERRCGLCFLER